MFSFLLLFFEYGVYLVFSDSCIACCPLLQMSGRGSDSGGKRRSDRLAKGKAVAYAPETSLDTDDEYDALEDPHTRTDSVIARNLQEYFDAEAASVTVGEARPPPGPGITISGSARSSGASRRSFRTSTGTPLVRSSSKRLRVDRTPPSADPIPEDFIMSRLRYPPKGGIRPRYLVITPVMDTPLLTNLINHPLYSVRRCEVFICFCMSLCFVFSMIFLY